ncbi:hypothetical protein KSF_075740 [Reticulibacter mediterranei]|uniref:Uncharacterized protein n=1 Tax=Reticulibacter mediterranei TaxID=2778369 RepID=A0A8J3IMZ4_9CHLR|nr:hypothetical protein KSF_075740 [Reticulibacter mediterranei]
MPRFIIGEPEFIFISILVMHRIVAALTESLCIQPKLLPLPIMSNAPLTKCYASLAEVPGYL